MSSYCFSFSYQKLKKAPIALDEADQQQLQRRRVRWRPGGGAAGRRWRRPRLRISGLGRLLRRKATVLGERVRASVAKVARRLQEGRPYVGDLFAGNYMFMQVAPSPAMASFDKAFLPLGYRSSKVKVAHPALAYNV